MRYPRYNARAALLADGWENPERGWWVKEGVGGACLEAGGKWYAYPADSQERRGPFQTLTRAAYDLLHPGAAVLEETRE